MATHFACYDGNGNVVVMVDSSSTVTARYEYGPFGDPIGVRGPYAETNPIRWSTKYTDCETELVYYGSRYYSPSLGRWISRDPIEEDGGKNLYAFVANSPVHSLDALGQILLETLFAEGFEFPNEAAELAVKGKQANTIREVFERLNNITRFMNGVLEANNFDLDEFINLKQLSAAAMQDARGQRSGNRAFEALDVGQGPRHHVMPKAKALRKFFTLNKVNIHTLTAVIDKTVHQALHRGPGRGGDFNKAWAKWKDMNRTLEKDPFYVLGFGVGLLNRLGFGAAKIVRF
jgi:RHS repeat-associated protein